MAPERNLEILLVEDNPNDVELTLHALKKHKLANDIEVARDGVEALDLLFGEGQHSGEGIVRPRVILLDLKLPLVDGIEVLKRVRGDTRTNTLPIVVLTSSQEERDLVEAYNLGVNSYIVKPLDFAQFTEAVREIGMYWLLMNQPIDRETVPG